MSCVSGPVWRGSDIDSAGATDGTLLQDQNFESHSLYTENSSNFFSHGAFTLETPGNKRRAQLLSLTHLF